MELEIFVKKIWQETFGSASTHAVHIVKNNPITHVPMHYYLFLFKIRH